MKPKLLLSAVLVAVGEILLINSDVFKAENHRQHVTGVVAVAIAALLLSGLLMIVFRRRKPAESQQSGFVRSRVR